MNPAPTNPRVTSDRSDMGAMLAPASGASQSGQLATERRTRRRYQRNQDRTLGRFSSLRHSKSAAAARQSVRRSLATLLDFMQSCQAEGAGVRGQRLIDRLEAALFGPSVSTPTELLELRRAAFAADQNEDFLEHEVGLVGMDTERLRRWLSGMTAAVAYEKQLIRWAIDELERRGVR